jgi:hypothetical protein
MKNRYVVKAFPSSNDGVKVGEADTLSEAQEIGEGAWPHEGKRRWESPKSGSWILKVDDEHTNLTVFDTAVTVRP